jgi:hypothetical protein
MIKLPSYVIAILFTLGVVVAILLVELYQYCTSMHTEASEYIDDENFMYDNANNDNNANNNQNKSNGEIEYIYSPDNVAIPV